MEYDSEYDLYLYKKLLNKLLFVCYVANIVPQGRISHFRLTNPFLIITSQNFKYWTFLCTSQHEYYLKLQSLIFYLFKCIFNMYLLILLHYACKCNLLFYLAHTFVPLCANFHYFHNPHISLNTIGEIICLSVITIVDSFHFFAWLLMFLVLLSI